MLKVIFFGFLTVVQASLVSRARGVTAALSKQGIARAFSQTPADGGGRKWSWPAMMEDPSNKKNENGELDAEQTSTKTATAPAKNINRSILNAQPREENQHIAQGTGKDDTNEQRSAKGWLANRDRKNLVGDVDVPEHFEWLDRDYWDRKREIGLDREVELSCENGKPTRTVACENGEPVAVEWLRTKMVIQKHDDDSKDWLNAKTGDKLGRHDVADVADDGETSDGLGGEWNQMGQRLNEQDEQENEQWMNARVSGQVWRDWYRTRSEWLAGKGPGEVDEWFDRKREIGMDPSHKGLEQARQSGKKFQAWLDARRADSMSSNNEGSAQARESDEKFQSRVEARRVAHFQDPNHKGWAEARKSGKRFQAWLDARKEGTETGNSGDFENGTDAECRELARQLEDISSTIAERRTITREVEERLIQLSAGARLAEGLKGEADAAKDRENCSERTIAQRRGLAEWWEREFAAARERLREHENGPARRVPENGTDGFWSGSERTITQRRNLAEWWKRESAEAKKRE